MIRALFHQRGQLNQTDKTEHDPEKCAAVSEEIMLNQKELKRDDDWTKSHRALA
jgi:hypothetical protein